MITERMRRFLRKRLPDGPCLVIDLDVVREKYREFERAMPETRIFYAVKANPAPEILSLLANLGSSFDAASVAEIEMALLAGVTGERISFGNTVKKKNDISRAYQLGVSLFTVDSVEEVEKIAQAAPRARVFCRILADGAGAEWPLSRKFGCSPAMAIEVLRCAKALGLAPYGVGFHVGSQQTSLTAWNKALVEASLIFRVMAERGIELSAVNLGGGFPAKYLKQVPDLSAYAQTIRRAVADCFGNKRPDTIIEPGRGLVGDAGVIRAEVVLVSRKDLPIHIAGSFSTSANSVDSQRRWRRRFVIQSSPGATTTPNHHVSWPAPHATARTCSTKKNPTHYRTRWQPVTR